MALSNIRSWPMSLPVYRKSKLPVPGTYKNRYQLINDKIEEIHTVVVHRFRMGDVEDPDLYAAEPLIAWEKSEVGQWVMEHAVESPLWHRHFRFSINGYVYAITAKLKGKDYTYWCLKWQNTLTTL